MKKIYYAVDLGSTTIDACLVSSVDGAILYQKSVKNRQSLYGSDVINRINATLKDSEKLYAMQKQVREDIFLILLEGLKHLGYGADTVARICISGNTTMASILLGLKLDSLAYSPFKSPVSDSVILNISDLFGELDKEKIFVDSDCMVFITGPVSPFIGGDILAGLYYLDKENDFFSRASNNLLIDLGTNGEMVLNAKGRVYATSTACGPAFEGSVRRQKVYGNSVIDAIALGLMTRKIDKNGVIAAPFFDKGLNISGVKLDMDIIHEILMAKAAIRTGIDYLVDKVDGGIKNIDSVYLAGGFGFYMNLDYANKIGLFDNAMRNKIKVVGNTSLKGSVKLLMSCFDYEINLNNIEVLMLAEDRDYQERLLGNMTF